MLSYFGKLQHLMEVFLTMTVNLAIRNTNNKLKGTIQTADVARFYVTDRKSVV